MWPDPQLAGGDKPGRLGPNARLKFAAAKPPRTVHLIRGATSAGHTQLICGG